MVVHYNMIINLKSMKNKILTLIIFTFIGCKTKNTSILQVDNFKDTKSTSHNSIREYSVQSVLWQQNSAEYQALCHQAFNSAKLCLRNTVKDDLNSNKPNAIVVDIDETLLDNSPYNANLIQVDEGYSKATWLKWGKLKKAKAVPGSLNFLNFAKSKNLRIFYLSNRYNSQISETMENLSSLGFPDIIEENFLLREDTSSKELRRKKISETYNIVLLIGDNLSDFSDDFHKESSINRNLATESVKLKFGCEFIILPNPMYGDWETSGIYEGKYDWSDIQKDSLRKSKLETY